MNQFSAGRMLGGIGTLDGPTQNRQFQRVVELVRQSLFVFAASAINEGVSNEDGFNELLSLFITKTARNSELPFFAQHQSMEDRKRGSSPKPDIGIHLDTSDTAEPPPKITVFEGKRLSIKLPKKRRQEYVIGYEEKGKHVSCGGIERFKLGKHGGRFNHAGMIGYLQDKTLEFWHDKINSYICDLCRQSVDKPEWSEDEQLKLKEKNDRLAEYSSIVKRVDDEFNLTHLWIDLTKK